MGRTPLWAGILVAGLTLTGCQSSRPRTTYGTGAPQAYSVGAVNNPTRTQMAGQPVGGTPTAMGGATQSPYTANPGMQTAVGMPGTSTYAPAGSNSLTTGRTPATMDMTPASTASSPAIGGPDLMPAGNPPRSANASPAGAYGTGSPPAGFETSAAPGRDDWRTQNNASRLMTPSALESNAPPPETPVPQGPPR